jgi:hypothetical protein
MENFKKKGKIISYVEEEPTSPKMEMVKED